MNEDSYVQIIQHTQHRSPASVTESKMITLDPFVWDRCFFLMVSYFGSF